MFRYEKTMDSKQKIYLQTTRYPYVHRKRDSLEHKDAESAENPLHLNYFLTGMWILNPYCGQHFFPFFKLIFI